MTCNWTLNGKFVISGSEDNSIKLWDTQNWECVKTVRLDSKVE